MYRSRKICSSRIVEIIKLCDLLPKISGISAALQCFKEFSEVMGPISPAVTSMAT